MIPQLTRQCAFILWALCCFSSEAFAEQGRMDLKCTFAEHCGSLDGIACFEPGAGFLLFFEPINGFSIVMYNEVWTSEDTAPPSARKDLTTLTFSPPSGEIAMLTVDENWNFALTIHYTGPGNKLNWESGTGQCGVINQ